KPLEIGGSVRVTNFFAVYDGNTDKLGLFKSDDALKIVRGYTLAKGHVESLAVFKDTMAGLEQQRATFDAMGQAARVSGMNATIAQTTKVGVQALRKERATLIDAADEAKTALRRYSPTPGENASHQKI